MNPIQIPRVPVAPAPPALPQLNALGGTQEAAFKDLLLGGIQEVNSMQQEADLAVQQLMTGEEVDPAAVLTAVQKADMSFRMMMQMRNKLVQAYQEIKEMRI